jgi:hypothetical protein
MSGRAIAGIAEWGATKLGLMEAGAVSRVAGEAVEAAFGPGAGSVLRGGAADARLAINEYSVVAKNAGTGLGDLSLTMGRTADHSTWNILGATHTLKFSEGVMPLARVGEITPGAGGAEARFGFMFHRGSNLEVGGALAEGTEVLARNGSGPFARITEQLKQLVGDPTKAGAIPRFEEYVVFRPHVQPDRAAATDMLGTLTHVRNMFR